MGGLSFVFVLLLNILDFILKILLFFLSMMFLTRVMMIFLLLNIMFVILFDNFILPKLPNVDGTVWGRLTWLILLIHVPIIFLSTILCTKPCYGTFSLVQLIMLLVFINLNFYLVLLVHIVMSVKKQLSIFFGTVPVGFLFVKNFPFFFVFLVLLVASGPQCFLHCGWVE